LRRLNPPSFSTRGAGQGVVAMSNILFGFIVPGLVFLLSFFLTDLLYRHFSRK
jgi:hypothetical protein